jgi:hypothetical protein
VVYVLNNGTDDELLFYRFHFLYDVCHSEHSEESPIVINVFKTSLEIPRSSG